MDTLQTPYFIIDEDILQNYYDMLTASLKQNWNNFLVGYSFKTNSLPWLVSFVKRNGAYAEVVSEDEYLLARYLGYDSSEIIYNGPYKSETSFRDVLLAGGYVNLDSRMEIEWLTRLASEYPERTFPVGVRVNFDLEKMCPGETTMGEVSGRFGFCYETGKFADALQTLRQIPNVSVAGLHLHSSSKSRSVNIFRSIARMACQLKQEFQLSLSYVDLGGGYCGGMEGRPEYPDYFPVVAKELSQCFSPAETKLIVEPGISLISKCSFFATSIYDTRDIKGTRYVMTDGSRFNIDATMIKTSHLFHVDYQENNVDKRPIMGRQVISGYTCMECDRMFLYENQPELIPGDKIIYENVGGYTMSLNPLFIQYFPPVYVKKGQEMTQVRRKWTPQDYVQGSVY
ncbi:MAG: pyridoxal-dependent decarboxylase [Bacillus sp. (in: Bacteria)]|nr:pyridoxal-dependent decarboxylase [Bacillus sp. (in: firmicutes)]MCM1427818.1 pyridoxal-dependent decarboxylase [Eubacterium sp.]